MPSIGLSTLDWLIIAVYFAFVLGLGFYLKRFTKTQEDFFMAGRKNSSWVAGIAFLSANLGALELLGMTGNTLQVRDVRRPLLLGRRGAGHAVPRHLHDAVLLTPAASSRCRGT